MPCSGSMANCMTLERMVMAPTARSPPYLSSEKLKQTEITLSLACMIKAAAPKAMQGSSRRKPGKRFSFFSRRKVFSPRRKKITHAHEMPCERMVASAAPRTPIFSPNINRGSNAMLATAPISTVYMPILAKPWAVIKAFIPKVSSTNSVPSAYTCKYSQA